MDYVVGGPWHDARLKAVCIASNCRPERVAGLYRDTALIVNVFRDRHHFNRSGIAGTSMNPRIYEALACGALVVSEQRAEIAERLPALPTYGSAAELVSLVERLMSDRPEIARLHDQCVMQLRADTAIR